MSLTPMENLISSVNEHLKYCEWCKGHTLVLEEDCYIGLALNYILSYVSCEYMDWGLIQKIFNLKRVSDSGSCYKQQQTFMLEINRIERKLKWQIDKRARQYISSPLKKS